MHTAPVAQSSAPVEPSKVPDGGPTKGLASSHWAQVDKPTTAQGSFEIPKETKTASQAGSQASSAGSVTPTLGSARAFVRGLTSSLYAGKPVPFAGYFTGEHQMTQ